MEIRRRGSQEQPRPRREKDQRRRRTAEKAVGAPIERLTPIDLERATPARKFGGGYDRAAVDELLKRAAKEIHALLTELNASQESAASMARELETYHAQETALKEALLLATKAADETRANAHKEAQLILQDSAKQVGEQQANAQKRINDMRWEIERLSLEKQRFESRFRSILQEHLDAIALPAHQPALVNLEVAAEMAEEAPTDVPDEQSAAG